MKKTTDLDEAKRLLEPVAIPPGFVRRYYRCRECSCIVAHDFIPYSLGQGVQYLGCPCVVTGSPRLDFCQEQVRMETKKTPVSPPADPMLRWFAWDHLPPQLRDVSKPFAELANFVSTSLQSGPERDVALRKLLEAKDAAVRAAVHPGN